MNSNSQVIEKSVLQIGNEIFDIMDGLKQNLPVFFSSHNLRGKLLALTMKDPHFKTALFRFIDTLPAIRNDALVARIFAEYMDDVKTTLPRFIHALIPEKGMFATIAGKTIRGNIEALAKTFIAGETPKEVLKFIRKIRKEGRAFTVDLLGEAVLCDQEAEKYRSRYLSLIDTVREETRTWQTQTKPFLDFDSGRPISPAEISLKMTSFFSRIDPVNFEGTLNSLTRSLEPVFERAKGKGAESVGITFDMEHYSLKELTLNLFESIATNFSDSSAIGIAIQTYLFDSYDDIQRIIELARKRKEKLIVRLVKGAYWDYETTTRKRDGQRLPLFTKKSHTDANFELLTNLLLENSDVVRPAIATHNVRSAAYTIARARSLGLPNDAFEFQALYGMAEPVKIALTKLGYRVREYVPMGEFIPAMAYFVRRLLENTSNESFLRNTFVEKNDRAMLLQKPELFYPENTETKKEHKGRTSLKTDFRNFPLPDLTVEKYRTRMQISIDKLQLQISKKPLDIPIVTGLKSVKPKDKIVSVDPSQTDRIIAVAGKADIAIAQKAIEVANAATQQWSQTSVSERASYLCKAATYMEENLFDLAALELFEAAKNRNEAIADVAEAIDFLRYYAQRMIELGSLEKLGNYPGEENTMEYIPKGVAVILPPWNFPLAIPTGMTAAALVSGNTAILKPSSLTPATGYALFKAFQYAGLPSGVLNFLPGSGDSVGSFLCEHPDVDLIAFTGSLQTAQTISHKVGFKKIVAETGGKNAIIVDDTADPDETALGVIASFSGYQGQKCSACSRLIILKSRYEEIIERVVHILENLPMGSPLDPVNIIGPVIDKKALQKIKKYIAIGKEEATLCYYNANVPANGYYVSPALFRDVPPHARIAKEEIFGPVLAIMEAADIEEAVRLANMTPFALTGGLYSRSPRNIEYVRKNYNVGNLYINKKITGALVNRQPFGGFKMSGLGTKAGGAEYLYHFTNPKVVSENTIRRGFAPYSY
ncbi:MAG: proline dehydrogenase family protein [Leptospirales bacterium]